MVKRPNALARVARCLALGRPGGYTFGMTRGSVPRALLAAAVVVLPALTVPAGAIAYLPLCVMPALFLILGLLFRGPDVPPHETDQDGDDGGDWPPVTPSARPSGGVSVPETRPSPQRRRDEHRRGLTPPRQRRPAVAPRAPRRPARRSNSFGSARDT
jgi:hypothetical protein